ncbi:MAG: hypothetical protein U1E76_14360 [Planctomycetota bacterium]
MERFSLVMVLAVLMIGAAGCEKSTVGARGKRLTLMKPADQTIKQGETNSVMITIRRDDFRDPVTIRFADLPAGVQVQDESREIAAEDKTATFTLRAAPDAALTKEHLVRVTASGPDGLETEESFKLTVKDRG